MTELDKKQMESTLEKINPCLWILLDETSGRRDIYVRTVPLDSFEVKNSSLWLNFKDGSGCLKRYFVKEGIHIPLISEVGGFIAGILTFNSHLSSHWTTEYIYLFNQKNKCLLGLAMSSPYGHEISRLLKDIEGSLSAIEEDEEEGYYEDEEEYENEKEI